MLVNIRLLYVRPGTVESNPVCVGGGQCGLPMMSPWLGEISCTEPIFKRTIDPSWANLVRKPVDSPDGLRAWITTSPPVRDMRKSGPRQNGGDHATASAKVEVG